ncbi:hypothetical protein MTO96_013025 [Rhipicephalus appendiculatus]
MSVLRRPFFGLVQNHRCFSLSTCTGNKPKSKLKEWESVVGIEVHVQIASKSKLFSNSPYKFGAPQNSQVSPFDASIPGTLPVLNRRCVRSGGPDCACAKLRYPHCVPLRQEALLLRRYASRIPDYTTKGLGLMELVFDACLKDGEEAASLVKELLATLRTLNVCSGKMEEGALRVDANVSVNRPGEPWGTRTEVKNLNSVRAVAYAVDFEIARQIKVLSSGWKSAPFPMRDKEVVQDYRFMPEPNLPPLVISVHQTDDQATVSVEKLRDKIPTLPWQHKERLMVDHGLTPHQAQDYNDAARFHELLILIQEQRISNTLAQEVLQLLVNGDTRTPTKIIEENDWWQITDVEQLTQLCQTVISENPKDAKKAARGKEKVLNSLMTKVNALSNSRAQMKLAKKIMSELLDKLK